MTKNIKGIISLFTVLITVSLFFSCSRDNDDLEEATFPAIAEVFIDDFSAGLQYAVFDGAVPSAFEVVTDVTYKGPAAMRFAVPDVGDPEGSYAGGTFFIEGGRDLSGFNVLTFYAKASKAADIDVIGFGVDLGDNRYQASLTNVPINTNWKKYFIPIPDPSLLTQEKGMLFYSEGPEEGRGYTFWIDEVKFEQIETINFENSSIVNGENRTITIDSGSNPQLDGLMATFTLTDGTFLNVNASAGYFDINSSNSGVATVSELGDITIVGEGQTVITAKLRGLDSNGSLTIESTGAPVAPLVEAPTPQVNAGDVTSIFSNAYTNVPVDFFNGFWEFSTTLNFDYDVNGDDIIRYTNLNFVGIQFTNPTIDVTNRNFFHIDLWTPDGTASGSDFKILLVDIGADNTFGGGDDTSHEITITNPTLVSEEWISLDIPLSRFSGLTNRSNLAQVVLSSATITNVYIDNIYFYSGEDTGGGEAVPPAEPAPVPTQSASNVISIYSDVYSNVANQGFNLYGAAAFEEVNIMGDGALKYTFTDVGGGNFQVIELGGDQINAEAAGMTNFRFDLWFPNEVTSESNFLLKLVDIPGAVTEALIFVNPGSSPAMEQGKWLSFDLPFSELEALGLGGRANIQQVVVDLINSGEVYIDNIYFYKDDGGGTGAIDPTSPAPLPTDPAEDVISIYSDAYTNVPSDGFNLYGNAAFEEVDLMGDGALKYSSADGGGGFQVIELGANQIDAEAAGMTNFRFDLWFPNEVTAESNFLMKLVDIPGAVTEALIFINPGSTPPMSQGSWLSFDIPFSELEANGLGGKANIQQVVIDLMNVGDVYIDNIYFYKEGDGGGMGPVAPTAAAPTPSQAQEDVISIYSDAYSNVSNQGFNQYGAAAFEEVDISGNSALKYTFVDVGGGNFQVMELGGDQIDAEAAGMTNFRFDLWFPNEVTAESNFLLKLVDIPGAVTEALIFVNPDSNPSMEQGKWLSFDFSFSELEALGLGGKSNLQQVVVDLINSGEVYIDNIYFYK